jgi:hypothetical protein
VKRILSLMLLAVTSAVYVSAQQTVNNAQPVLDASATNGNPQSSNAASSHDRHHRRHRSRHRRHHHTASQH